MVRLDEALPALCAGLEAALQAAAPKSDAPYVVLGNPAEANAKYGETSKGRLLVTLTGLRWGTDRRAMPPEPAGSPRGPTGVAEADLLVTADFPGQYLRGIRMMTTALDWVHDHPIMTAGAAPDAGGQFTIVLMDPSFEEGAALVDMAGVKGCPFALLRLRGLAAGAGAED